MVTQTEKKKEKFILLLESINPPPSLSLSIYKYIYLPVCLLYGFPPLRSQPQTSTQMQSLYPKLRFKMSHTHGEVKGFLKLSLIDTDSASRPLITTMENMLKGSSSLTQHRYTTVPSSKVITQLQVVV